MAELGLIADQFYTTLQEKGLSDVEIRSLLLSLYTRDHPAKKTSESVEIPTLNGERLKHQKDWIASTLMSDIQVTECTMTICGNTQESGKQLENSVERLLKQLHIPYKNAGSQEPIDFRNVSVNEETGEIFIETKKTNGTKILLNDSIPKRGTWYLIYSVKYGKLILILADILLKDNDGQLSGYKRINECLRHDYKHFGDFFSAARMNLNTDIRRFLESDQNIFWDVHEDLPPLLDRKEEQDKAKQLAKEARDVCRMGRLSWELFQ